MSDIFIRHFDLHLLLRSFWYFQYVLSVPIAQWTPSMTYLILCPIFHLSEVDINGFTVFTWSTLIATLRLLRIIVQVGTPTYQCCKVFQCCLTTPNSNLIHTLYQAHNIHIYIYMLWVDVYGVLLCVCVCVCKDWVRVLAWPRLIVMLLCVLVLRRCSLIRQVLCSNN